MSNENTRSILENNTFFSIFIIGAFCTIFYFAISCGLDLDKQSNIKETRKFCYELHIENKTPDKTEYENCVTRGY